MKYDIGIYSQRRLKTNFRTVEVQNASNVSAWNIFITEKYIFSNSEKTFSIIDISSLTVIVFYVRKISVFYNSHRILQSLRVIITCLIFIICLMLFYNFMSFSFSRNRYIKIFCTQICQFKVH